mgnify:CR=1 FL=1
MKRREFIKWAGGSAALSFIAPSLFTGCSNKSGNSRLNQKPNIVFILIDTLRADRLGAYGYQQSASQAIDAVAAEGAVFENVISPAPWTQPAMASLFSSTFPGVHKVVDYGLANRIKEGTQKKIAVFDDRFVTLAEVLKQAGYETAAFNANILLGKEYGFAQGFDLYADRSVKRKSTRGDVLNSEALAWLKQRDTEKPFFLYMHYMDVHGSYYARDEFVQQHVDKLGPVNNLTPLTPKEKNAMGYINGGFARKAADKYPELEKYREFWSALYDAAITEMDYHIKSLVEGLKELGLWDECYTMITADHGEELCERGIWSHGLSLYHTELHVPLLLRWPGTIPAGQRIPTNTQLIDIMPTLMDQLSLETVPGLQGRSLTSNIEGKQTARPVFSYAEAVKTGAPQFAAYLGQWKLLLKADPRQQTFAAEYYDLKKDPSERVNLAEKHPAKVKQLSNAIQDQINTNLELGQQTQVITNPMASEHYDELKSLGYVE